MQYFFWLGEQAFSGLLFAWPITLATILFVVVVAIQTWRKHRLSTADMGWLVLPAIVPLVILMWGAAFQETGVSGRGLTWQAKAIYVIFSCQLIVAAIAIWRVANARLLAFAMSAFVAHYSFWSAFVAGMSVTDDWL